MTLPLATTLVALALVLPCDVPALAQASSAEATALQALGGEDVSIALEGVRAKSAVPGVVAMAIQDGQVLAWGAAGVRVQGGAARVSIRDPFHLGSCTKAMTSTLAAILIEDGLLAWDTKVFDVLPELKEGSDPGFAEATIEHLLRHRAGIAERERPEVMAIYERFAGLQGTLPEQRLEVARMALKAAPHTAPGVRSDYSNYGYMTAAAMLERLTGRAWEELIVERLLEPLGMHSAGVGSPHGDGVPVGHQSVEGAWVPLSPGPAGILPESMAPAGLLHSSLLDWSKFVSAHVAGARGADGLVKAETFRRLQTDPGANSYACGWGIGSRKWGWGEGAILTHSGSDGTWYSNVLAIPEWDLIVLAAVNCAEAGGAQAAAKAEELILRTVGFAE